MAKLKIKMRSSIGGESHTLNAGEEHEVEEELARALCTLPEHDPRAEPIGWEIEEQGRSTPAGRRSTATDPAADNDGSELDGEPEGEPEGEDGESAPAPRGRRRSK
jgi:hypothetical protein